MLLTILNSFTTLQFSGEKAQTFLQGQLTCDMRELSSHGAHSLAAVCTHQGRMIANFWVIHWHNDFLCVLPKSLADTVKNHLQKYAVLSKIIISHPENFFIATKQKEARAQVTAQPESNTALQNAIFIQLPSENRYLIIAEKNPFEQTEINSDETDWKKNNIRDQLCILYPKTSLLFTPQMIGLEKLGGVSFTKGCYVGQEIVARTQHLGTLKRHLHRLPVESNHPLNPGDDLKNSQGEAIGVIVEAVKITQNHFDVLAVVRDKA